MYIKLVKSKKEKKLEDINLLNYYLNFLNGYVPKTIRTSNRTTIGLPVGVIRLLFDVLPSLWEVPFSITLIQPSISDG